MLSVSASFESKKKRRDQGNLRPGRRCKLRTTYPAQENMTCLPPCYSKPKPNKYSYFSQPSRKKKIHSTFCCHNSFLFFPLKAPSAGLSNLFLIVRIMRANQYRFRKLNSVVLARYATANQDGTGSSSPGVCSASQTS